MRYLSFQLKRRQWRMRKIEGPYWVALYCVAVGVLHSEISFGLGLVWQYRSAKTVLPEVVVYLVGTSRGSRSRATEALKGLC